MHQRSLLIILFLAVFLIAGCVDFSMKVEGSSEEQTPIGMNMVWLNHAPLQVQEHFENLKKEGGLHTHTYKEKTYLFLNNPYRMITSIQEDQGQIIIETKKDEGYEDHPIYLSVIKKHPTKGFLVKKSKKSVTP